MACRRGILRFRNGKKRFFFEKKKQKTSGPAGCGNTGAIARISKSFLLRGRPGFFQKRSAFLSFAEFSNSASRLLKTSSPYSAYSPRSMCRRAPATED
jgi:hypothetical protein